MNFPCHIKRDSPYYGIEDSDDCNNDQSFLCEKVTQTKLDLLMSIVRNRIGRYTIT